MMERQGKSRPDAAPTGEHDRLWAAGFVTLSIAALALLFADAAKSQTLAAWVQAIGSIAAIFIALRLGQQQNKAAANTAAQAQHLAESGRQRSVIAIADAAYELATNIRLAFATDDVSWKLMAVYDPRVIDQIVTALNSVPLCDIGTPDGVSALLSLRLQFVLLGNAVDAFIAGPWRHSELGPSLRKYEEDGSFDRVMLQECVATGYSALRKNVFTHLDVIDRDRNRLQGATRDLDG